MQGGSLRTLGVLRRGVIIRYSLLLPGLALALGHSGTPITKGPKFYFNNWFFYFIFYIKEKKSINELYIFFSHLQKAVKILCQHKPNQIETLNYFQRIKNKNFKGTKSSFKKKKNQFLTQ